MLHQTVHLTVFLTVNDGQSDAFLDLARSMTESSKKEQGTLAYEWFAEPDGKRYRLVEIYRNAAAVEAHFAGPAVLEGVPVLVTLCKIDGFEIYGDPGPTVTETAKGMGAIFFTYKIGLER